jgi:DNA polymerase-3 subunit alpha
MSSQPRPYVPLHLHTHYSLLDGATRIPDLIKVAKANNMPAVAVTDHGVMYGAVELYSQAKAAGIKPIIGCEIYFVDGDIEDRQNKQRYSHLILLCKNWTGYQNLTKIVSTAQLKGFYYKPRTNWELLEQHHEGLVALTACLGGPIARPVIQGNLELARERAKRLKGIFGDDLFLEIQDHKSEDENKFSAEAVRIGRELDIPLVMTNDSHYTYPTDTRMHDVLLCMQMGKLLNDPQRMAPYGPEFFIKNGDQMAQLFGHLDADVRETALNNTLEIADRCNIEMPLGQSILPNYPLPDGVTPEAELRRIVEGYTREKYPQLTPDIQQRMDYELNIINQMGFPAYFLIVWDFINHARQNNIPVGPGRGSAAGSLVAYSLGITNIDPIEHNLLFERFLNPERISMPDIDIDFCIERREQVIDYVMARYGQAHVCQIVTFGTLAARAAVKGVARTLDIPFAESDRVAKMIPATPGTKLKDALEEGMELRKLYDSDANIKEWIDLAKSIEGTNSNIGVHAAGVVISKDPLMDVVPLQLSKEGQTIAQYAMGDLEKMGLLKMDFLGLRNLTIIDNTLNHIEASTGNRPELDHLPLDDEKVYSTLSTAQTDGVFQLESSGMKALVKDLKPSVFEDINALVALFRPGPLNSGMVKQFVDRKHGRARVEYQHPDLEPILKDTYGTIVYQEQIMQIAQSLAGYSLGQADLLRRAMGKKKADVMEKEREGFIKGAIAHNVDERVANELFDAMTEFAAYCFNRSHSAAYALIAYQTAWLKTHYPVEYLSALLSSVRNDLDKVQHYMLTARRMGIAILPPDVTKSGANFTPDLSNNQQAIRFGLATIKNVGLSVVESIIAEREQSPFDGLEDFFSRMDSKVLNRKTLESLVQAGALDCFGQPRKRLFNNIDNLVDFAQQAQNQRETGQVSLFSMLGGGDASANESRVDGLQLYGPTDEYPETELQQMEKILLGFYVSSHPLNSVIDTLPLMVSHTVRELAEAHDGAEVVVGGLVGSLARKMSKSNRALLVGQLEDLTGSVEFVVFGNNVDKFEELVAEGQKIIVEAKLQFRGDDSFSLVLNNVRPMGTVAPLQIQFEQVPRYEDVAFIRSVLAGHKGNNPVILSFADGTKIKTGPQFWVNGNRDQVVSQLQSHFKELVTI